MSKDLPQPQPSEEVDLGQLFKLIGNAFSRFFNFIGSILNKLFLAFVWMVFFIKKHIIKIAIAGVIGFGYGYYKQNLATPVYQSYVTIKQNYETGETLHNTVIYYNDLVSQNDIKTLVELLNVSEAEASSILNFDMKSIISENQKLKNFDSYKKGLDSTFASTFEYGDYLKNDNDYNHELQQITIKSRVRNSFKKLFDKVVNNINSNEYFVSEQEKDLNELSRNELALKEALAQSDSLKNTYKRVLEKVNDVKSSQTSVTIESGEDKNKTKEYDLYLNDLELRRELVEIQRKKDDKKQIVEIISSKQDSGSIDNKKQFFGLLISPKIYYSSMFMFLVIIALFGLYFVKFLEKFKDKISN